jgi:hypothetical protein
LTDDETVSEVLAAASMCMLYGLHDFGGLEAWLRIKGYVRDEKLSRAFLAHAVLVFEDIIKEVMHEMLFEELRTVMNGNSPPQELP